MQVSILVIVGLVLYFLLYFLYGRYLAHKVVEVRDEPTPAVRLYDGVDFVPANKYVLFGHHFASIAGAGPIVGPAIGIAWGWLPALAWVWLGNVIIGAVHDYLSLMSSVRYDGHSVQWIAGRIIKKRTGYIFSIFVFFVLVLVVAAFAAVLGKLFVKIPAVPTSYLIKIVGALILGVMLYRMRVGLGIGTIFCCYMARFFHLAWKVHSYKGILSFVDGGVLCLHHCCRGYTCPCSVAAKRFHELFAVGGRINLRRSSLYSFL